MERDCQVNYTRKMTDNRSNDLTTKLTGYETQK
jgi:hypothetical protein